MEWPHRAIAWRPESERQTQKKRNEEHLREEDSERSYVCVCARTHTFDIEKRAKNGVFLWEKKYKKSSPILWLLTTFVREFLEILLTKKKTNEDYKSHIKNFYIFLEAKLENLRQGNLHDIPEVEKKKRTLTLCKWRDHSEDCTNTAKIIEKIRNIQFTGICIQIGRRDP